MLDYPSAVEQELCPLGSEQDLWPLNIGLPVCQMQPSLQTLGATAQEEKVNAKHTITVINTDLKQDEP